MNNEHRLSPCSQNRPPFTEEDHTFAVCAFGKSPYLETCILSCLHQSLSGGKVILVTSTPNSLITHLAEKYSLPLYTHSSGQGIAADWNEAIAMADTPLVTIAHQDDIYSRFYRENILHALNSCRHPLIAFSDYVELRHGQTVTSNKLLRIKRLMLMPLIPGIFQGSRWIRRRCLSFGNCICCPSVTYVRENLAMPVFTGKMKSNIDWDAWEHISRERGEFVYIPRPLMQHRIHGGSTTSQLLEKDGRREEDLIVLRKFWPAPVTQIIEFFYKKSEKSNNL